MQRRAVITGLGAITPLGHGHRALWEALLAGRSGITPVTSFDTRGMRVHLGAEIHDFVADDEIRRLDPTQLGRASQLAVAAARRAVDDARLDLGPTPWERAGVVMGTTSGEPREVEHYDDRVLAGDQADDRGELAWRYPCHVIAGHIAAELGLAGLHMTLPTACAAGNYALAYAYDALRAGRADVVLAGGADAFSRITYCGFARLGAIAPDRCQPFDRHRQGMIPGEGAAVLVLETLEHARARGARPYAEITGYGLACDAHHMTAPHPEGLGTVQALRRALESAGRGAHQVSYISAHGTGTPANDRLETAAIKRVFGEAAYRVPVSSIKAMLGHTMGAASAIEAVVCALAVTHGQIPPTIHYETPDPDCDLDWVPNTARRRPVDVALSNAAAFGGNNAAVVFERVLQ